MADYQEYRRRVLRKRWRRRFMATGLLLLLLMVGAIGMLWKSLHRETSPSGMGQNTILQEVTQDDTWNTVSYAVARPLTVQALAGSTATALVQNQLKVYDVLQNNDAYHALKAVDGLIITGATGTNVNDVAVVLIGNQG